MIKYNVRSRQLVDIVNDIKQKKIILSPYFQRKMVWRTIHKVDFIKTILFGFPFPEIFLAKGDLNIDEMTSTSCVVDGQQRLNSIIQFIAGEYDVEGQKYVELSSLEKERFLKYELAIIELDIKHDDHQIREIFKRLNRTYYSLSNIEKLSSEFAPSEFMLLAKLLAKELDLDKKESSDLDYESDLDFNPNIPKEFLDWASKQKVNNINKLIIDTSIFSPYEISRQVHLNFVLNILGVVVNNSYFNRNVPKEILELYSDDFPDKDNVIRKIEAIAKKILQLRLKKNSYWYNKANMFTLILTFYERYEDVMQIPEKSIKLALEESEEAIPEDYQLAAKEGVNNRRERLLRKRYIDDLISSL